MPTNENAKQLAERLTEFLLQNELPNQGEPRSDLTLVLSKLDDLTNRLVKVERESAARNNNSAANDSSILLAHPSLQKFEIPEVAQFLPHTNIKACAFEPNGKPCDECAMCSSRGF